MQMDPRIILAGQAPNVIGAIDSGTIAAQRANELHQQNALADLYRSQGAGIAAGDQNALNALAGISPQAALGIQGERLNQQSARQGMDVQLQNLDLAKQQGARQADAYARSISAEQAAAEAAKINAGMQAAMMAQTPEAWNAVLAQNGMDPQQFPFESRDAILAGFLGAADVLAARGKQAELAGGSQTFRAATPEEAAQYGAVAGQVDEKTGRFYPNNPPSGMAITSDGQGGFSVQQGPGVTGRPLTVEEGKTTGYLIRAERAEQVLGELEKQGTSIVGRTADMIPGGNFFKSKDYQKFDQAKRNFINAQLRRESGAVISDAEFANAEQQYFPVPGDGPEVIAQKRQNRIDAIEGLRVGSGAGADKVKANGGEIPDFAAMTPEQIRDFDWQSLSGNLEALKAYSARLDEVTGQ